jgi:hypothetical protein
VDKVILHCCNFKWVKGPHPCHKARKALDESTAMAARIAAGKLAES